MDKYGISWQIVPTFLGEMLKAKETDKTHRMLKALWQMQKLDIGHKAPFPEGISEPCLLDYSGGSGTNNEN